MGADDPAKKGVCSNFLCDSKPGDEVTLTGPSGKVMLIPEKDPNVDLIMVATGTGIAPYRSFIRRLFVEKTPFGTAYKGLAWLFLGVANSDALLYDDEWQEVLKKYPDNFKLDYALSREQTNVDGGKMYIQDKVKEYADTIFDKMDSGAHMYFCGLKGMMPGITGMLEGVCEKKASTSRRSSRSGRRLASGTSRSIRFSSIRPRALRVRSQAKCRGVGEGVLGSQACERGPPVAKCGQEA